MAHDLCSKTTALRSQPVRYHHHLCLPPPPSPHRHHTFPQVLALDAERDRLQKIITKRVQVGRSKTVAAAKARISALKKENEVHCAPARVSTYDLSPQRHFQLAAATPPSSRSGIPAPFLTTF